MTTKEIEAILAKYYDGETTLREEHRLREFFLRSDVPERLLEHKPIFGFFNEEGNIATSETFDHALEEKLRQGKVVSLINRRRRITYALSIAAGIVLVAGLIITFQLGMFSPSQPYGTISDPNLAYVEARNALFMVSERFNAGVDKASRLGAFQAGLDKARQLETFQTGFTKAEKFNRLSKYQPIILTPDDTQTKRP
ncbi:MAG: hypothetical protein JRJ00_04780 [Deltaproteobacteria bacterium]|nr:hypothetical protein [Deltaproteobacteria bacterium]